jgi:hypothetical protein
MSAAGRLLRLPIVLVASGLVFVLFATLLTSLAVLTAGWLAYATCRNALTADRSTGYIRGDIADLEYHLAKETEQ